MEYQEALMEYQEAVTEYHEVLLEAQVAFMEYHGAVLNNRKLGGIPSRFMEHQEAFMTYKEPHGI